MPVYCCYGDKDKTHQKVTSLFVNWQRIKLTGYSQQNPNIKFDVNNKIIMYTISNNIIQDKWSCIYFTYFKTLWPLFLDGVQLHQG